MFFNFCYPTYNRHGGDTVSLFVLGSFLPFSMAPLVPGSVPVTDQPPQTGESFVDLYSHLAILNFSVSNYSGNNPEGLSHAHYYIR